MRKVCKLGREVLDLIGRAVKPGITTDDLDKVCHDACIERNCYPSPLNYRGFPKSVCTSVNEVICHGTCVVHVLWGCVPPPPPGPPDVLAFKGPYP